MKGLKLRVPEIKTWVDVWKEIGALPTPVAWPEVFTALQTGVVNGQENPIPVILSAWTPPVAAMLLSLSLHLHLEDG